MIQGEFKKVLEEIFHVLEFTEAEQIRAIEGFKKRLAFETLKAIQGKLPEDQKEWLNSGDAKMANPQNPEILKIQETIKSLFSEEEMYNITRPILKNLMQKYIDLMSRNASAEKVSQMKEIVERF